MKEDDFKSGDRRDGGRPTNGRRDDARNSANNYPRPRRDDQSGSNAPRRFESDRRTDTDRPRRDDHSGSRPFPREGSSDRRSDDRPRPAFDRETNAGSARREDSRPASDRDRPAGNSAYRPDRSGPSRFGSSSPNSRREEYPKPKFDRNTNSRWESKGGSDRPRPSGDRPNTDRPAPRFNRDADRRDDAPRDNRPNDRENDRRDDRPRNNDSFRDERPRSADNDRQRSGENRFGQERRYAERPAPNRSVDARNDAPRDGADRPYNRDTDSRDNRNDRSSSSRPDRPYNNDRRNADRRDDRSGSDDRPRSVDRNDANERPARRFDNPANDRNTGSDRPKPYGHSRDGQTGDRRNDRDERRSGPSSEERRTGRFERAPNYDMAALRKDMPRKKREELDRAEKHDNLNTEGTIRLNRYIANAGICSRREADELIAQGTVQVNGKVVTEMGHKVQQGDVVKYGNRILNPEKMVYVLLNKPKDYITTTEDPEERRTVMELVADAGPFRIYPVGRLDRNTTGLMLMTNDGELAEKLTHPSNEIKKIYQVELDKPITDAHFEAIQAGIELEDGMIKPDDLSIVTPDAQVVGIEIHSGRNRIVRRIFESLGYEVTKLDRTAYAGLSKKDLPRGKWRFLEPKEVVKLKYLQ